MSEHQSASSQLEKTDAKEEHPDFLSKQIITYLGNKRSLLNFIGKAVEEVQARLGKEKLITLDLFAGSGVVSRYLKKYSKKLYSNDLESYSAYVNDCYLTNYSELDMGLLNDISLELKANINKHAQPGFITELYAPKNESSITEQDRVFYTRRNAIYIDTARQLIDKLPLDLQKYFLAPLLYKASVHNNTSGIFKGFYKNKERIGQYGGEGKNALARIMMDIDIPLPIFSAYECETIVMQKESLEAVESLPELDLCYMDPPYNQHPYGSNYFMLNLILNNERPQKHSKVSGIPCDWNRSAYNRPKLAKEKLFQVISACPAKFILISYNSEGFISYDEFIHFLQSIGSVKSLQTNYNTFKGSRNLRERKLTVTEYLFLLEKN